MTATRLLLACAVLASTIPAQTLAMPASFNPDTAEGNRLSDVPFLRTHARVQSFYSAAETGMPAFVLNSLRLRYDGPVPQVGTPGPFTVSRLRVMVGVTAVAQPGADLDGNLTAPLTTLFDGQYSYLPSPNHTSFPAPWGGPNDQFRFPAPQPLAVSVPPGGWFALQLIVEGNNNATSHAILDAVQVAGGPTAGTATSSGTGCPAAPGGGNATIGTTGQYAPGTAHSIHGNNLGSNALVVTLIGVRDDFAFGSVPLPFAVPGSSCSLYTSLELTLAQTADASGVIAANRNGSFLVIPPDASLGGARLYEQHLSVTPSAAPLGLALSDKRTVSLGTYTTPIAGVWHAYNDVDAAGTAATRVAPLAYTILVQ